jgi:hypothetical protein
MKAFALAFLTFVAWASVCPAAQAIELPADAPLIQADWQDPSSLPRRFRNHCANDTFRGRLYCSDHCGREYQFYYCKQKSFGCCRIGYGYCDWNGLLRCAP